MLVQSPTTRVAKVTEAGTVARVSGLSAVVWNILLFLRWLQIHAPRARRTAHLVVDKGKHRNFVSFRSSDVPMVSQWTIVRWRVN